MFKIVPKKTETYVGVVDMRNTISGHLVWLAWLPICWFCACGESGHQYERADGKKAPVESNLEIEDDEPKESPSYETEARQTDSDQRPISTNRRPTGQDINPEVQVPTLPPDQPRAPLPEAPPTSQKESAPPASSSGKFCLETGGAYTEKGPYGVKSLSGFPGFTVWTPDQMGDGCPKPIVSWGNGTGVSGAQMTNLSYGHYAKHMASWGFVVIYSHANGGLGNSGGKPLGEGIDLIAQKLGTQVSEAAGTMGHSQGGKAALEMGKNHSKVKAIVSLQGYGSISNKPTMYLTGSRDTSLAQTGVQMYQSHPGPAYLAELSGADHVSAPTFGGVNSYGKQYGAAAIGHFRCYLADDPKACTWLNDQSSTFCQNQATWSKCQSK